MPLNLEKCGLQRINLACFEIAGDNSTKNGENKQNVSNRGGDKFISLQGIVLA